MPAIYHAGTFELSDAILAQAACTVRAGIGRTAIVGLCGAQGSGKSTTAARLSKRLQDAGRRVVICSLDDFYLTRGERAGLARDVHPLLATRGVPGTHDVALLASTLAALTTAGDESTTPIPAFDKASDDRLPAEGWHMHRGRADVVLLEGWCIGARPQPEHALELPLNALEEKEDADGRWRRFVNARLADDYARLFAMLDLRLMLRAPSFACVHGWRAEQERGLDRTAPGARAPMGEAELSRFIAHYERITRWLIEDEPADLIVDQGEDRAPFCWRLPTAA